MDREFGQASSSGTCDPNADSKDSGSSSSSSSANSLKAATADCLNSWIYYLQMLNSVCSAGLRLSQCLNTLAQSQSLPLAAQCQASWEELTKATVVASHTVKTHIAAAMQDIIITDTGTDFETQRQHEHNQQIVMENLLTFINLQYQFSIANCECLGPMAMCPSCQTASGGVHDPDCSMATLQQCFARLHSDTRSQTSSPHSVANTGALESPKAGPEYHAEGTSGRGSSPFHEAYPRGPSPVEPMRGLGHIESIRGPFPNPGQLHTMKYPWPNRGSRSPLHFPLFPLSGQRRWSEAAAREVEGDSGDGTMRRWSMPWDCGRAESGGPWHHHRYMPVSKLAVPPPPPGVQDNRSRSTTPEATGQPAITSGEGLAEAIQLLSCRPIRCGMPHGPLPGSSTMSSVPYGATSVWGESHEDRLHRRAHANQFQRGNWQSTDVTTPSSGMSVTEHYDIFPPVLPLVSRKSSSSTDSSSCLSIHSRSTNSSERSSDSGGGDAFRLHTHLYSMWNDHLPFIRVPESQEPPDDTENDDSKSDNSGKRMFPKPV